MKQRARGAVRPQSKIASVNDRFGNPGMKKQQGSTIEIYDTLLAVETQGTYEFFIDAQNRSFPFTNLLKGQLTPQESFVMERMYFALAVQTDATGAWASMEALDLTNYPGFNLAEIEVQIENQRVVKPIPVKSFSPQFNPAADNDFCHVMEFDTQIVIPPLQSFKVVLKVPPGWFTAQAGTTPYLICTMGGPGGIFAPKANY